MTNKIKSMVETAMTMATLGESSVMGEGEDVTSYTYTIHLVFPAGMLSTVMNLLAAVGIGIQFKIQLSVTGQVPATYLGCSGSFNETDFQKIKNLYSPGGAAYVLGGRARLGWNVSDGSMSEVQMGETIPAGDWWTCRVSFARFAQEVGNLKKVVPPLF